MTDAANKPHCLADLHPGGPARSRLTPPTSTDEQSGVVLGRHKDKEVGVGADDGLVRPELVGVRGARVILNHVIDVEDLVGLLFRHHGEDIALRNVLAQIGIDPRKTVSDTGCSCSKSLSRFRIESKNRINPQRAIRIWEYLAFFC